MSAKHTPGPWSLREHGSAVYRGNKIVCRVNAASPAPQNMGDDIEMAKANARLIAAAPELLEALVAVSASLAWQCHGDCRAFGDSPILPTDQALDKARAVIAKAAGEQA